MPKRPIRNLTVERVSIFRDIEALDLEEDARTRDSRAPVVDAWGNRWQYLLDVLPLHPIKGDDGRWYQGRKLYICIHSDMSQNGFLRAWEKI
jgi:hypothetical protein